MSSQVSSADQSAALSGKYLTFFLGSEEYGIAILKVREIIGIVPVTPVPGTPSFMQGVINLRGKIIPVIDLRAKFGMPTQAASRETCIIVVRRLDLELGIVVDAVSEVRNVAAAETDAMLDLGGEISAEYFLGISKADGKVRLLLDIDRILSTEDVIDLSALNMSGTPHLSAASFSAIRELIFAVAGISMTEEKEELVKARLAKRLRELKIGGYEEYLERVQTDRAELSNMVDVLTTNKTSFFREQQHFDYLVENVFPVWRAERGPRRIWSAGCSSGEEPYTLGMLLREHLPQLDVRILATDLSTRVLARAKAARYAAGTVEDIPPRLRDKYLRRSVEDGQASYQVTSAVTALVAFARLNLMGDWPMRGAFDLILCRNVMIYFSDDTRTTLACRFAERLAKGATLMIGHAESLASLEQPLQLIEPAIYAH